MSGTSALVDPQTLPSQLALPAPPEANSPDPPFTQPAAAAAAVAASPGPVQLATASPQQPVAFSHLAQIHSHSIPPTSAVGAPYHQTQLQLASQVLQPSPVLSVLTYDSSSGTLFDPRSGLATKIKGGLALASLAKTSNKYSPY